MDLLEQLLQGGMRGDASPDMILFSLLLSFILGQTLAWVYYFTHQSLSYSKSFVQSIVLMTVIVSMVMVAIGGNLVTAFGLMGALAMIRFRHMIKDSRDITFVSSSLVVGMAVGSQRFSVAIIGTVVISVIAIYLYLTAFGTHQPHNAFLRFAWKSDGSNGDDVLQKIIKSFCRSHTLISTQQHSAIGKTEYAYQLMIKNASKNDLFVREIEAIEGVENVNLVMQEQLLEV